MPNRYWEERENAKQLKQYKADIAGIQETRWGGYGKIEKEDYTVWCVGEEKQGHGNGVYGETRNEA